MWSLNRYSNKQYIKEKEAGLSINEGKTKITIIRHIKIIKEEIYLGHLINIERDTDREVNRRIVLSWKTYWGQKHVFKGPFSYNIKVEMFNTINYTMPMLWLSIADVTKKNNK